MIVDTKTLLAVLLGGRAVFTSKPMSGEIDRLHEKCLMLRRELPCVEVQGASKKELERINQKAVCDEIYKRIPKLKKMKGDIDKASKQLAVIAKTGMTQTSEITEYSFICSDLLHDMERILGANVVNIKFPHQASL